MKENITWEEIVGKLAKGESVSIVRGLVMIQRVLSHYLGDIPVYKIVVGRDTTVNLDGTKNIKSNCECEICHDWDQIECVDMEEFDMKTMSGFLRCEMCGNFPNKGYWYANIKEYDFFSGYKVKEEACLCSLACVRRYGEHNKARLSESNDLKLEVKFVNNDDGDWVDEET